jgi:acetyltransferase-like isoleucine patch superfamily enzyme
LPEIDVWSNQAACGTELRITRRFTCSERASAKLSASASPNDSPMTVALALHRQPRIVGFSHRISAMSNMDRQPGGWRAGAVWRVSCTIVFIIVVEALVCGAAALPAVVFWRELSAMIEPQTTAGVVVLSLLLVPSYVTFALALMVVSPLATFLTRARTPPDAEMRMSDLSWPLMRWARYMVASHLVRMLAGTLFRGSPVWTVYLRLNGARIGSGVYVNTLFISDHNLLEIGDGVVIGSEVHLSGHTVEDGMVKTARVRVGSGATIGLGTLVDVGVTVGPRCQIGAMSLVPKYTILESDAVYVGVPVRRIDR